MAGAATAAAEAAYEAKGKASWDSHEWGEEARDAHGRWIQGISDLKNQVDALLKSGKIDKAQHAALLKAAVRHSQMGRGIPADAKGDTAKTLQYLAQTLRQDSLDSYKSKGQGNTEGKFLSRTARAIENIHAALTGKPRTGPMAPLKHPPVHPDDVANPMTPPVVVKKGSEVKAEAAAGPKVVKKASDKPPVVGKVASKVEDGLSPEDMLKAKKLAGAGPNETLAPGRAKELLEQDAVRKSEPAGVFTPEKYPSGADNALLERNYQIAKQFGKLKEGQSLSLPDGTRIVGGTVPGMAHGGKSMPRHWRVHYPDGTHQDIIGTQLAVSTAIDHFEKGDRAKSGDAGEPDINDQQKKALLRIDGGAGLKKGADHPHVSTVMTLVKKGYVKYSDGPDVNGIHHRHYLITPEGRAAMQAAGIDSKPYDGPVTNALYKDLKPEFLPGTKAEDAPGDASGVGKKIVTHQIDGNGKVIRQIRIESRDGDKVTVTALNGPMKGSTYEINASQLATEPSSLRDQQNGVKLPIHALAALKNYVTGSADGTAGKSWASRTISKHLRSATPLTDKQQKYADDLDDAFKSVPETEQELTLHRGINTTSKSGVSQLPKDLKVGDTFGDNGYMSTSLSSKVAEDFATPTGDVLHLTLPKGAHPLDVNAHVTGAYGAEREVLLPRGAQIKVTSIKDRIKMVPGPHGLEERRGRTIHGELILPDAPKDLPADTDHEVATDAHMAPGAIQEPVVKIKSKLAGILGKIKGPKVVKKMQVVKVSGENVRVGDIMDLGKAKAKTGDMTESAYGNQVHAYKMIKHERRVEAIEKTEDGKFKFTLSPPLDPHLTEHDSYVAKGIKSYGGALIPKDGTTAHIGATGIVSVKREVDVTKSVGTKITLDKAPTTKEFKAALDDALKDATSPEDIAHLDPSHRALPAGHKAGHAQQIMFDLAVGKLNGVSRGQTVKSDDEYHDELNAGSVERPLPEGAMYDQVKSALMAHSWPGANSELQSRRDAAGDDGDYAAVISKFLGDLEAGNAYEGQPPMYAPTMTAIRTQIDKTTDQYRRAHNLMNTGGKLDDIRDETDRQTPYTFLVSRKHVSQPGAISYGTEEPKWAGAYEGKYPDVHSYNGGLFEKTTPQGAQLHAIPSTTSKEDLQRLDIAARRDHNGIGSLRYEWHLEHPNATLLDFVHSPEFAAHFEKMGTSPTADLTTREKTRSLIAKARGDEAVQLVIDDQRGMEGTVKFDSGLPTWDEDSKLESQKWSDVAKRAQGITLAGKPMERRHYADALEKGETQGPDGYGGTTGYTILPGREAAEILSTRAENLIEMAAMKDELMTRPDAIRAAIDETARPGGGVIQPHDGKPLKLEPEEAEALKDSITNSEASWEAKNPETVYRDYVPTFHTQGMVEDGVLYHKQEDGKMDPEKLRSTLIQSLRQAGKRVKGQTEPAPLTGTELRKAFDDANLPVPGPLYSDLTYTPGNALDEGMVQSSLKNSMAGVDPAVKDVVDKAFASVAGRTKPRSMPTIDVDALVRSATDPENGAGLDSIRQWIDGQKQYADRLAPEQADEMTKGVNIAERGLAKSSIPTTTASVEQDSDLQLRKAMEAAGAVRTVNSKPMQGKGTWTELKPGDMMLITEGGKELSEAEQVRRAKVEKPTLRNPGYTGAVPGVTDSLALMKQAGQDWSDATTLAQMHDAAERHTAAAEAMTAAFQQKADEASQPYYAKQYLKQVRQVKKEYGSEGKKAKGALSNADATREGADRRIEYVPWSQGGTDSANGAAPRSQRGRLTLEGYTPEEATAKLKEMGIVGDLETHIPGAAIFRSGRRIGDVSPLHSDYVRGDAPVPDMDYLMTHGLTDSAAGGAIDGFKAITNTGGLMSIADRFKRGIRTRTSSQVGDVGSGIDHVVFLSMDGGSTCGSGSPVRIAMRPDVTMRRDILVSPVDFGGGKDRYPHYKKYRDELEARAGMEVGKSTIWTPLAPAARQLHLADQSKNPGSAEYDVAHQIRVEDMQAIAVKDQPTVDQVTKHLNKLLEDGVVTRVPKVILQSDWDKNIFLK